MKRSSNLIKLCGATVFLTLVAGCFTQRDLILESDLASMTEKKRIGTNLKKGQKVTARFCNGDEPILRKDGSPTGKLDEALYKAQTQTGTQSDFIADAKFYSINNGHCIEVKGFKVSMAKRKAR